MKNGWRNNEAYLHLSYMAAIIEEIPEGLKISACAMKMVMAEESRREMATMKENL
jgi:hypothetical protein